MCNHQYIEDDCKDCLEFAIWAEAQADQAVCEQLAKRCPLCHCVVGDDDVFCGECVDHRLDECAQWLEKQPFDDPVNGGHWDGTQFLTSVDLVEIQSGVRGWWRDHAFRWVAQLAYYLLGERASNYIWLRWY